MIVIKDSCGGPYEVEACQDYFEVLDYSIFYSLPTRQASTEYFIGDMVLPEIKSGIYLQCVQPGVSSADTNVIFPTRKGSITDDGTVRWKTVSGKLSLQDGEVIQTSTWEDNFPTLLEYSSMSGTIPKIGDEISGETSGATGLLYSKPNNGEILIYNITGTFQQEKITAPNGWSATISSVGNKLGQVSNPTYDAISTTIWVGPVDKRISYVELENTIETTSSPVRKINKSIKINFLDH